MCRMVLEWREREHGDVEEAAQADLWLKKRRGIMGCISFGALVA